MEQLTPFETLLQLRMLDAGLIPHSVKFTDTVQEVRVYMATLTPEDRRVSARKFRKMWRKAAKFYIARSFSKKLRGLGKRRKAHVQARQRNYAMRAASRVADLYVVNPTVAPSNHIQRERSRMVLEMFMQQIREELAHARSKRSGN
jgi:hypothetical protein